MAKVAYRAARPRTSRWRRGLLAVATTALTFVLVACPTAPERSVLRVEAIGAGTVRVDGVERSLPYEHHTLRGGTVRLAAVAATGHTFARWEDDLSGSDTPTTIVVDRDRSVRAVFVRAAAEPDPSEPDPGPEDPEPEPDPEPDPPDNDDFANRAPLEGASGSVTGSNVGATKQPDEPDHAGVSGGASVWWSWTAPAPVTVTFDVGTSDVDAVVAVYEGTTLTDLRAPAGVVETDADGTRVTLTAVAGRSYQLAVDGRDGATGMVALSWSSVPAAEPVLWTVEPQALSFVAPRGGTAPAAALVVLRNDGDTEASFELSAERAWLHAAPSSGMLASGASIDLTVTTSACTSAEVDSGAIMVSGGGSTAAVEVERTCEGAHWRAIPADLTLVGEVGDEAKRTSSFTLWNDGTIEADVELSPSHPAWLRVDPATGTLARHGNVEVVVSALACTTAAVESGEIVIAGGGHGASVAITRDCREPTVPPPIGLSIDRVYVNQAVPAHDSGRPAGERMPLVAQRAGLLRVFATADDVDANEAQVWFHYRHGAGPEHVTRLDGPESVPANTSEGSLSTTYDVLLPAAVMQPGLQGYVTLRASVAGEAVEARYPATAAWTFDVRTVAPVDMTLVPVTYRGTTPVLGDGLAFLGDTVRMFPMAEDTIDVRVGATPWPFDGDLGTGAGWIGLLNDIIGLHLSDPEGRHHYGVVDPGYTAGIAGIAWVGHPVAAGWSHLPSGSYVAAHELGHNWGLGHAPCNVTSGVDPAFPYPDGSIGVWGYDLVNTTLRSPSSDKDLMSYCQPAWVSDYHYRKVMDFRAAHGATVGTAATDASGQVLVVRGWADAEAFHLDPLLITTLRPQPFASGPYTFIAWDAAGAEILRVPFDTIEVSLEGLQAVHLTLPIPGAAERRLSRVRVERNGQVVLERDLPVRPLAITPTRLTHLADGRVSITWDTRAYAALMVRDGPDGILLGRDHSGQLIVHPSSGVLELLYSDGLNTERDVVPY